MRNHTPRTTDPLRKIRCFALDLDGTIYLGDELFPFTLPFLDGLRRQQRRYVFVTNNSSRSSQEYVRKLRSMGISLVPEQVYTSGDATIRYLKRLGSGRRLFLLGTEGLHADFERHGFQTRSPTPDYVVLGFDMSFTYDKFDQACRFVRSGIPFIATHPDLNCPMPNNDMLPDCGSLSAAITAATGVAPTCIGKPNKEMIDGLLERVGVARQELAIVGDRLTTDIRTGAHHDIVSILVLSGETQASDLDSSAVQPTLVFENLHEMLCALEVLSG
jgi:4-nitrophenyl phosphatase